MSNNVFSAVDLVILIAGRLEQPGSPMLQMALLYDAESGTVNGLADIGEAVTPPSPQVVVRNVTGQVHGLGLGGKTRVLSVSGEYSRILPAPAIGTVTEKFAGTFVTDNHWKGDGSFEYGGRKVDNVPVTTRN